MKHCLLLLTVARAAYDDYQSDFVLGTTSISQSAANSYCAGLTNPKLELHRIEDAADLAEAFRVASIYNILPASSGFVNFWIQNKRTSGTSSAWNVGVDKAYLTSTTSGAW
jgi:hypothetical protein